MNYGKKGVLEKKQALNSMSTKWGRKVVLYFVKILLIGIISVGVIGLCAGIGMFRAIIDNAPEITPDEVAPSGYSSFVYDIEGRQTAKLVASNSNRIPVGLEKIPANLAHAFVAIEDERFYEHNGIDIQGILRAGFRFVTSGGKKQEGASTITQQLLKNTVFTDWMEEDGLADSIKRKFQEQYLALEITKELSKDEILLRYMNTINLGQNTLGVQAASLRYFNKDVSELTLSECAVIAGITKNPSAYNPISHPDKNNERRETVLLYMWEQGYITEPEYKEALADDVYSRIQQANQVVQNQETTSYFIDAVTEAVYNDLIAAGYSDTAAYTMLYSGGIKIYSTQDPSIQGIADNVFTNEENYPSNVEWLLSYRLSIADANGENINFSSEMFTTYFKEHENRNFDLLFKSQDDAREHIEIYKSAMLEEYGGEVIAESISMTPQPQVSITIEDPATGYVVAMVGGRGTKEGSRTLNRATSSTRSPGSTFKILATYAPGLDSAGLTLATVRNDAPFNYDDGTPVNNYDRSYRGLCSIRFAIQESLNIVAVKNLTVITPQLGFDYLKNFGFTTLVDSKQVGNEIKSDIGQSLTLGGLTNGVTNYELNAAYASIANHGIYIKPKLYTKVVDRNGNVILDNTEPDSHRVIKETTAFLLTSAMQDVVTQGTGTPVNFGGMPIAGKTGTSNNHNDVWFAGFTPYYTATVWTGYDCNGGLTGDARNLSKRLWKLVMQEIHSDLPTKGFAVQPEGIITAQVCSRSGKLPIPGLCDATLVTEFFEEGTVPTTTCDVHFQGVYCQYSNLPATSLCPFQATGVIEMIPAEDPVLQKGSSTLNPDASTSPVIATDPVTGEVLPVVNNMCPHNEAFFANPAYQDILYQQQQEFIARSMANQQAAEQAYLEQQAASAAQ